MRRKQATFKFKPFSRRQLQVLTWWTDGSPHKDKDAIICDGSVRSGKTIAMSLSYVIWAMQTFNGENLGMAGKTIGALRRNVIKPLKLMLKGRGYKVREYRADNYLTITHNGRSNDFYLFGGKDERSQDLIQGITLAGMFFDEVALMPESFVNQATARCSVEGSKLWFNCNPEGPYHWFKREWLDRLEEKNALHLHFTMEDNLSLSERVKQRYYRMYSGVFFKRYILGLWVMAEGIIYDMFNEDKHICKLDGPFERQFVAVDYGTQNPCTFGLYGVHGRGKKYHLMSEYYYDGRAQGRQKTDAEYADDLEAWLDGEQISYIIVDPSAASFIAELCKRGWKVVKARNDVLDGIRVLAMYLNEGCFTVDPSCKDTVREFYAYVWDEKAAERGEDKPVQQFDHTCDRNRYAVYTDSWMHKRYRQSHSGKGARV